MPIIKEVVKLWGTELWHHNDADYCMKTLVIRSGALHYHVRKRETFLCIQGVVRVDVGDKQVTLQAGESVTIEPGTPHRFWSAKVARTAVVVEAGTQHDDDDVVRIEPSRLL
jgi:mannose-6-phosphate isomerase-like protein (cupin superfamily)